MFVSDMLVIATYNIVFLVLRKRYFKKWRIEECKDHIETQVTINHHTYFPLCCFYLIATSTENKSFSKLIGLNKYQGFETSAKQM